MRRRNETVFPVVTGLAKLYRGIDIPVQPAQTPPERFTRAAMHIVDFWSQQGQKLIYHFEERRARVNERRAYEKSLGTLSLVPELPAQIEAPTEIASPKRHLYVVPDLFEEPAHNDINEREAATAVVVNEQTMRVAVPTGEVSVAGFLQERAELK